MSGHRNERRGFDMIRLSASLPKAQIIFMILSHLRLRSLEKDFYKLPQSRVPSHAANASQRVTDSSHKGLLEQ